MAKRDQKVECKTIHASSVHGGCLLVSCMRLFVSGNSSTCVALPASAGRIFALLIATLMLTDNLITSQLTKC